MDGVIGSVQLAGPGGASNAGVEFTLKTMKDYTRMMVSTRRAVSGWWDELVGD